MVPQFHMFPRLTCIPSSNILSSQNPLLPQILGDVSRFLPCSSGPVFLASHLSRILYSYDLWFQDPIFSQAPCSQLWFRVPMTCPHAPKLEYSRVLCLQISYFISRV